MERYKQLSEEERHLIAAMRAIRKGVVEISARLGRDRSTIFREVARNRSGYDGKYRAEKAQQKTNGRRRRSRRNRRYGREEFGPIEELIVKELSPEQVVGRRRREGQVVMSHETIYKWIWADKARGGDLWRHLRGARKRRRKRYGRYDSRGRLAGKRLISERPQVVEERSRIGDWEIDTVHGRGKACVVTVVERRSRLVRIGKLPAATKEETTHRTLKLLRREHVHTITADNGSEFHGYKQIESGLEVPVYFASPHHAWERGTNENTNGLIRQYLPKGTDLHQLTQFQCTQIAEKLNNRPRRTLGFLNPNEVYSAEAYGALQT